MKEYELPMDSDRADSVRADCEGIREEIRICGNCAMYSVCSCSNPNQRADICYVIGTLEKVPFDIQYRNLF
jgi:hypothetical protein